MAKADRRDPYQILEVAPTARPEAIEAAYRRLARMYHPDLHPDADSQNRMKDINWARDLLRDPIQRVDWDVRQGASPAEAAPMYPPSAAASARGARAAEPRAPVKLPLLAWIGFAVLGLALSVALLPRVSPANIAATATGAPSSGIVETVVASAAAPSALPSTQPARQNPLRAGGCLLWSEVGRVQIGQDVCVFGIVAVNEPRSGSSPTVIQFSQAATDMRVQDFNRSYAEALPGTCVLVRGRVIDDVRFLILAPSSGPHSVALYPRPADCR
jgi:hypothetical protein